MIEITKDNIDEEIKWGITVILFWGEHCDPCKIYLPHFELAASILDGIAKMGTARCIDMTQDILIKHEVEVVPTTIFYRNGERIKSFRGFRPKEWLIDYVKGM